MQSVDCPAERAPGRHKAQFGSVFICQPLTSRKRSAHGGAQQPCRGTAKLVMHTRYGHRAEKMTRLVSLARSGQIRSILSARVPGQHCHQIRSGQALPNAEMGQASFAVSGHACPSSSVRCSMFNVQLQLRCLCRLCSMWAST